MKVLKFGGTSVGSVESILQVKRIVEAQTESVIVVVSALGGVTDKLILMAKMASAGDSGYELEFEALVKRHEQMIRAVIPAGTSRKATLYKRVRALLSELQNIYRGLYLLRDISAHTMDTVVSYGERLSSLIASTLIDGAELYDSRQFMKTEDKGGKHLVNKEQTEELVSQHFDKMKNEESDGMRRIALVPGFISTDVATGRITNLGRGGSDYTAAILAAVLNASVLEIWTDVDGFMTADPRVISTAYVIEELSYVEAMELCNFGAKVVYPPTIYPAFHKNIPILIKNTFNASAPGTIIRDKLQDNSRPIKGISSIGDTNLINVTGLGMVGIIGINQRIFGSLAAAGISVFLVAQPSSESSTSIGVRAVDAEAAAQVLDTEFAKEIALGEMNRMQIVRDLATVAIVGENMRGNTGIAGKLFGVLGRNGINVMATAQGASETNISFVVEKTWLRKTLNVIHDSFFLSEYNVLNLFVCGVGTVGSSLLEQIRAQREKLMKERGLQLNVVGIATGHYGVFDRAGIPLDNYRTCLKEGGPSNIQRLRDEVIGMNIFNSVFVDCTASNEVASLYGDFLEHNISVVAANKIAASSDYANYRYLKDMARSKGVKFLFETNVGAGLPIINTINDLINSGDRILKIEAVLSGTLNFIFNTISADCLLSDTIHLAKEKGFSEPDPRIDLSGKDVIRKLVILAREAGYALEQDDVERNLFIPQEMFEGSMDDFWERVEELDEPFEKERQRLVRENKRWRFVATLDQGHASVGLKEVNRWHPLYNLEGSNNIILLTTERYKEYPMMIQGYGAGAAVTAAGVFADIMSIANI
ncbi:MAG: bifunctional aspartate kinase/homoserine dehydrogenase I [Bacteroidaceae bacterium]|nr:bifunctional aspartate kinase/homoserine dehydrogenase I [Bacteroidaceae bacterium]